MCVPRSSTAARLELMTSLARRGGKVAMALALGGCEPLSKLVGASPASLSPSELASRSSLTPVSSPRSRRHRAGRRQGLARVPGVPRRHEGDRRRAGHLEEGRRRHPRQDRAGTSLHPHNYQQRLFGRIERADAALARRTSACASSSSRTWTAPAPPRRTSSGSPSTSSVTPSTRSATSPTRRARRSSRSRRSSSRVRRERSSPSSSSSARSCAPVLTLDAAVLTAGAKSKYINSRNIPIIKQFFPDSRLETLDAGHWGASRLSLSLSCSL